MDFYVLRFRRYARNATPGSDAGVFVWADGAGYHYCAVNANARCNVTLKNSQRHAEERTSRPFGDIPVMHTTPQIYDGVCWQFQKIFFRESQTEPTVRLFV